MTPYTLRPIEPADKPAVSRLLTRSFGASLVYAISLGGMVDASDLPGWIAEQDAEIAGLVTHRLTGDTLHIVTLNAFRSGGIGAALIERVVADAGRLGAARIRVTTTNDNTRALRFYQRCGFRLIALHPGAVTESRRHKPEIPELGNDDIPVRDELDLELRIESSVGGGAEPPRQLAE